MSLFRGILNTVVLAVTLGILTSVGAAQNPVPQVVGPPSPQAVKPGGGDFTLKVYGANFVPRSVVNWNRQPRATTYISGHEVDATILASDIVSNTAGYISVTNPPPGGGLSSCSWSLVEVHEPTATIVPDQPHLYIPPQYGEVPSLLAADFNNDGILDFAIAHAAGDINIRLGNGDGTSRFASTASFTYYPVFGISSTAYGDFNGDGNIDLAFLASFGRSNPTGLGVNLGNGDGTFRPGWRLEDNSIGNLVVGDFNRDGKLDLVSAGFYSLVYLGNGDGTFRLFRKNTQDGASSLAIGDFNGDGILDMVFLGGPGSTFVLEVALGNGDGTFQKPRTVTQFAHICSFGPPILVSDFNGDGKLDIAFCTETSIGILLSNGDGTFQKPVFYRVGSGGDFNFVAGDFNSDGKADLIVSHDGVDNQFSILIGNGDGTFRPKSVIHLAKYANGEAGMVTGDFNSDGLLDFAMQPGGFGIAVYPQK
jgi:hypothetical protein